MDEQTLRKLRSKLDKALAANQNDEAIRLLTQLSAADSSNARWPHKQGDLLRKLERYRDAASAYASAADLYAEQGFLSRAVAIAKTVANLDPRRLDVLERIDPEAAKQFKRNLRPPTQPFRQSPVRPDERAAPPARVTMQGFANGPRAPAMANKAAQSAAKPGPMQGSAASRPMQPLPAEAPRKHPMVLDDDAPVAAPVPPVSPRQRQAAIHQARARESTHSMPAVSQRLTTPGRRHPMVLDDNEPAPAPPPRAASSPQQAARIPARVDTSQVSPAVPQRLTMPGRRHPAIGDPTSAPAAPPRAAPSPQAPAPPPRASQRPAARQESATEQSEDDEIIIVVLDEDLESETEGTAAQPSAAVPAASRTPPAAPAANDGPRPVVSVPSTKRTLPPPPLAPAGDSLPPSAAVANDVSPPKPAATPAKRTVALDRLSVPPPRLSPASPASNPTASSQRAMPSPLPPPPARAVELAPPPALGDAEALELPTGKVAPLPSAHPARRPRHSRQPTLSYEANARLDPAARAPEPEPALAARAVEPKPRPETEAGALSRAPERRAIVEVDARVTESQRRSIDARRERSELPPPAVAEARAPESERRSGGATDAQQGPQRSTRSPDESARAAEEFSRALEAAVPPSIVPQPAAGPEASQCVDALRRLPYFAKLDADTLGEIAGESTLIELNDAASVVSRGAVSDALYGILGGSARLSGVDRNYEVQLGEGDLFGEACVLSNEPCQADVIATGPVHAVKIPRGALTRLLKRKPRMADELLALLTERLRLAVEASPLFRELEPSSRRELGARFEVRRASKDRVLAEQDVPLDGLYVSLTGLLTVEKPGFVSTVAPAFSLFGHQLLLASKRSPATITARRNLLLLRLPAGAFGEVALNYPRFAARLARSVSSDVVPLGE